MIPLSLWPDKQGADSLQRISRAALAALALAVTALTGSSADAHALVLAAQPAVNATVPIGDLAVRLEFNSRIDRARSRLTLLAPDAKASVLAIAAGGPDTVLAARAYPGVAGRWTLRWQVLSLDGHITRGDIPFVVVAP